MAPEVPIGWGSSGIGPSTVLGMTEWEDIRIETSFRLLDVASSACIATRTDQWKDNGIFLCVNTTNWVVQYGGTQHEAKADPSLIIERGSVALETDQWYIQSSMRQQGRVVRHLVPLSQHRSTTHFLWVPPKEWRKSALFESCSGKVRIRRRHNWWFGENWLH